MFEQKFAFSIVFLFTCGNFPLLCAIFTTSIEVNLLYKSQNLRENLEWFSFVYCFEKSEKNLREKNFAERAIFLTTCGCLRQFLFKYKFTLLDNCFCLI